MKSIFRPDPGGKLTSYDAPQTHSRMVWGHPSQVSLLRSRRIWNEVVIGCRENGFPGPAAAVDGPCWRESELYYITAYIVI